MAQPPQKRPFVVGIAGGSASGKSTFAEALKAALESSDPLLSTEILSMDRYQRQDEKDRPEIVLSMTGETMFDWNTPESFDTHRLAGDIDAAGKRSDAPSVLLVEGLIVLHAEEVRAKLNLGIFVELEADERVLRRMLRNMSPERGSQAPHFIAGYYRESARVGHARFVEPSRMHADLIVRGDADFDRIAPMIAAMVKAMHGY